MALPKTGIPDFAQETGVHPVDAAIASASTTVSAGDGGPVQIADAALLTGGQFMRHGSDLHIQGADGAEVVVQGYFTADPRPDLVASDGGAALTPGLVDSFMLSMAPGQYAQSAGQAQMPIGQVDELKGEAFAVRADGTRIQLAKGDPVFEGDIIETGAGDGAIRMLFVDKTVFALGSEARLALDELVFDPAQLSGTSQFSILKGVFIFSSGQIAKTDNTEMTVVTPVATIGIRGTEVAGRIDDEGSQFTVIDGAIEVTNQSGSVTLDDKGETTLVSGVAAAPSPPVLLAPAEYGPAYADVAGVAAHFFSASDDVLHKDVSDTEETLDLSALEADFELAAMLSTDGSDIDLSGGELDGGSLGTTEGETVWEDPYADDPTLSTTDTDDTTDTGILTDTSATTDTDGTTDAGGATDTSGTTDSGTTTDPGTNTDPGGTTGSGRITLTVSDSALDVLLDPASQFQLPDLGPNSTTILSGAEMNLADPTASLELHRDANENVKVDLLSAWLTLPNLRADSDVASDLTVTNVAHSWVFFGNGGDSHILLDQTKDGVISTGDGNDLIDIRISPGHKGGSVYAVTTGAGDDTVIYDATQNGNFNLAYAGGGGTDTLKLTSAGDTFDLSSGNYGVVGIERVDLSAAQDAYFEIFANLIDVLTFTSGVNQLVGTDRTLVIDGGADDQLDFNGETWNVAGNADIGGQAYTVYEHGTGARVVADADMVMIA